MAGFSARRVPPVPGKSARPGAVAAPVAVPSAALVSNLRLDPVALPRRVGLRLPATLSLAEWTRIGQQLSLITDSSVWWLGDWLVHGESTYPDRYRRVISHTSLDYQTLRNYAWVTRKFPIARRRPGLSFQHHAEVASLAPAEQDRWLDQAVRLGWSRNELRRRVRAAHRPPAPDEVRTSVTLKVPSQREQRWRDAADAAGLDLVEWIAVTLDQAAAPTQLRSAG